MSSHGEKVYTGLDKLPGLDVFENELNTVFDMVPVKEVRQKETRQLWK